MNVLTPEEKDFMLFLNANKEIKTFDDNQKRLFASLLEKGMVARGIGWTNRGIIHLVVDCGVSFLTLKAKFDHQMRSENEELTRLRKYFGNNNDIWINIFYYLKYKQYIEWDLFDENHYCTHDLMDQDTLQKFVWAVFEKLIDDGRIPLEKVLSLYGLPEHIIKITNRDIIKEAVKMYRG